MSTKLRQESGVRGAGLTSTGHPDATAGATLVDGFLFTNYALRHLPVGRVSLYSVLTAPIGVPIAWFVLGESVSTQELIAIPLVVFGVALPAISGAIRSRWSTGKQPPS